VFRACLLRLPGRVGNLVTWSILHNPPKSLIPMVRNGLCHSFLTSIETPFLDIRPRFAWRRPSVDEAGCRYRIGCSWGYDAQGLDSDRSGHTSGARGRSRHTVARRFMDTHRGDTADDHRAVEHLLAGWRSVDSHPLGNPRCRPGTARTWRLVGRCSPFWMEAHRPSRSKELVLIPLWS